MQRSRNITTPFVHYSMRTRVYYITTAAVELISYARAERTMMMTRREFRWSVAQLYRRGEGLVEPLHTFTYHASTFRRAKPFYGPYARTCTCILNVCAPCVRVAAGAYTRRIGIYVCVRAYKTLLLRPEGVKSHSYMCARYVRMHARRCIDRRRDAPTTVCSGQKLPDVRRTRPRSICAPRRRSITGVSFATVYRWQPSTRWTCVVVVVVGAAPVAYRSSSLYHARSFTHNHGPTADFLPENTRAE